MRKGIILVVMGTLILLVSHQFAINVHEAWSQSFLEGWLCMVSMGTLIGASVAIVSGSILIYKD